MYSLMCIPRLRAHLQKICFIMLFNLLCRRKENAISSLTKANQLVKTIAMGRRINFGEGTAFFVTSCISIFQTLPSNLSETFLKIFSNVV